MNREQRITTYTRIMPTTGYISCNDLKELGFFDAPASTKYHGAYEGGLFDHSLEVTKALVYLTDNLGLTWSRPESPYIVGMYHDLCKCDSYRYDIESDSYKYNKDQILDGHGSKSIIIAQKYIDLTDEEIACIRWHMGAYEKDTKLWNYYGRAIEEYSNVLYTHTADMIASKIKGI
nr:MAG TPA: putative HD superfamily hydrolase [Caudoviricetes sp.]